MTHPLETVSGVRRLVGAATTAPSLHNSQPWRFRVRPPGVLELRADLARMLWVSDPRARELHISCGAALYNVRLATRITEHRAVVSPLPGGRRDPTLLAEITLEDGPLADLEEIALYDAMPRRRTNRGPFEDRRLPLRVLLAMVKAADAEGTGLRILDRRATSQVLRVIGDADAELAADPRYRAELEVWTAPGGVRDGVPSYAFGPRPRRRGLPMRDFGLARQVPAREPVRFEAHPLLAVLTTTGDGPADWLRAGQALQRVLLTATSYDVATSFFTQPLELRDMRGAGDSAYGQYPQMIIRLGYGQPVPGSPRRSFREVIDGVGEGVGEAEEKKSRAAG